MADVTVAVVEDNVGATLIEIVAAVDVTEKEQRQMRTLFLFRGLGSSFQILFLTLGLHGCELCFHFFCYFSLWLI